MNGKKILTAASALSLCGLLCACAADNTVAARGSMDARLKAVEGSLHKAQEDLKTLAGKQGQDDARVAELQKKLGELLASLQAQGLKTPSPLPAKAPAGSALGVGFARPASGAPKQAVAASPAPPISDPAEQGAPTAPSPEEKAAGAEPMVQTASGTVPASAVPSGGRHKGFHVGPGTPVPTEPPATGAAPETPAPTTAKATGQPAAADAAKAAEPAAPAPEQAAAAQPSKPSSTESQAATPSRAAAQPAPVPPSSLEVPKKASSLVPDNAESASPGEKAEYNRALQMAINGRTADARAAFEQFMTSHPQSALTPNALYWVGENSYAGGDYQKAVNEFERVSRGWPGHHKAADSLYKVAMAQEKLGDVAAARATLERFLKDYPNAEMAGVARQKLQTLSQ